MWLRPWFLICAAAALLSSCGTTRKLSQVGLREPSSIRENATISAARQSAISAKDISKVCPAEVRTQFVSLAGERVRFPDCPDSFSRHYEGALQFLKLEERSTLEEVLSSHCHSLGLGEFGDSLEDLTANFDSSGPLGRRNSQGASEGDIKALLALKSSLDELVDSQLPLERWGRRFGSFVIPEEDLQYLSKLIVEKDCHLGEEEVDAAYRSIRSLEDLSHILKNGAQREGIGQFLSGVHKVIDRRLQEFFPK